LKRERDVRALALLPDLVDFVQMTVAKSDLRIAETYASLASIQRSETACEKGSPRSTPASCLQALARDHR
jgi:hypothetical protein